MRAGQPRGSAGVSDPPEVSPADVDAAHAKLLSDSSIQFELKPADPPVFPPQDTSLPEMAGPLAEALFWVVLALAAAGLLYLIVKRFAGWRRTRPQRQPRPNRSGGSRKRPHASSSATRTRSPQTAAIRRLPIFCSTAASPRLTAAAPPAFARR
jgi:hypothetical protein